MAGRQISAYISEETGKLVDEYTEAHGLKKGFLVETALLHHLQALRELPADVIIPPRIVVSEESMRTIIDLLERPQVTTPALKKLMRGRAGTRG